MVASFFALTRSAIKRLMRTLRKFGTLAIINIDEAFKSGKGVTLP